MGIDNTEKNLILFACGMSGVMFFFAYYSLNYLKFQDFEGSLKWILLPFLIVYYINHNLFISKPKKRKKHEFLYSVMYLFYFKTDIEMFKKENQFYDYIVAYNFLKGRKIRDINCCSISIYFLPNPERKQYMNSLII